MSQIAALVIAPPAPWLLAPTQAAGVIVETACVLAAAAPLTVVYPSGGNDVIAAGVVATVYGGTSTPFDRTAGPWLVVTVRTSTALQVVRETDLATVTGTFAVLARITRLGVETNPSGSGTGGAAAFSWRTITASATLTSADSGILVDATAGNVTVTLPTAVGVAQPFAIKRIDTTYPTHTVTIATTSAQTIDGGGSALLTVKGHGYVVGSDGTNWEIEAGYFPNPLTTHGQTAVGDANAVPVASSAGGPITAAAGAQAGTTPPAPVVTSTADDRGVITFGTGTGPAAGAQVVATFAAAFAAAPVVVITALNSATQALGLYVSARTTGGFTVSCTTAPAASQANTVYSFNYIALA